MTPPVPGRPPRLIGQKTRGKTAPNRLRKTDTFLGVAYPDLVRHMPGLYVDLGYGAYPVTSVETLRRLRRLKPDLCVLGVEIDPERVAEAAPFTEPGLEFRLGGLIDRFFAAWHAAWQHARARADDPRQIRVRARAALRLADHYGYPVDHRPVLLRRAFLWLGPEWPKVSHNG